jgi:hypothetical protein
LGLAISAANAYIEKFAKEFRVEFFNFELLKSHYKNLRPDYCFIAYFEIKNLPPKLSDGKYDTAYLKNSFDNEHHRCEVSKLAKVEDLHWIKDTVRGRIVIDELLRIDLNNL